MKQGPDLAEPKRMKVSLAGSLGRMPLGVKFAFILVVTLLLPGVTPKSIKTSVETTVTISPSVSSESNAIDLEKEATFEKDKLALSETDAEVEDQTDADDSLDDNESTWLDTEGTTKPLPEDTKKEEIEKEILTILEEYNNGTEANTESEDSADLDDDGYNDEEANLAAFMKFMVKRAAEEAGKPETDLTKKNDISFSDIAKLLEPLVQAFSGSPEPEPSSDDLFSWFPALKKWLESYLKERSTAKPTGLPTNSATRSGRRSSLPTSPETSLQIAPAFTQAAESEVLPSPSLLEEFVTPIPRFISKPPPTGPPSLSDGPDSEEIFY